MVGLTFILIYVQLLSSCAFYHLQIGVFVNDPATFDVISELPANQTFLPDFSYSIYYYNVTSPVVLDGSFFTKEIIYGSNNTVGPVIINVDESQALCLIAEWSNISYVQLSAYIPADCSPSFMAQPSVQELLEISLSIFKTSDNTSFDISIILDHGIGLDSSLFVTGNTTLYSLRVYKINSTSLIPPVVSDIESDRIVVMGTDTQITSVLDSISNATEVSVMKDQIIVIPTDSFHCPEMTSTLTYVCIVPVHTGNTPLNDVTQYLYKAYLDQILGIVKMFTYTDAYLYQRLDEYIATTINSSNTSLRLNIIKYNFTGAGLIENMVGQWSRSDGLTMSDEAFPRLFDNKLKVVLIHEPPFVTRITSSSGEDFYEGYTIDILNEIARRVGFEYIPYYVPDGEFGILRADGSWSGMIGEVAKGAADIAAGPISVTAERETVIDFTAPYYDFAGLQLLMRDPTVYNDMFAFASAFTGVVWVTWFSIQISTAVILYLFHRLQLKTFAPEPQHNPFNFKECVWFVMGSITLAGADRSPITFSSRLLVAGFWFFCQIMMGTYTANLAAFMTSSRLSYSIESLEDLATQTSISYSVLKGTVGETYFGRMSNIEGNFYDLWKEMSYESKDMGKYAVWEYPLGEKYTKIWNAILQTGLIQTTEEGFQKLMSENFAYIHETPMIKYQMSKQCGLLTVGSAFSSKPYALVLQQNSPYLDEISRTILQMQSETIIRELKDKWWKNSTVTCPTTEGNQGLSMEAVGGIFIVMAIGCGISFLLLIVELSWNKYKTAKKEKNKMDTNKREIKENPAYEGKDELVTKKCEEDNISVIDLKYNFL